MSKYNRVSQSPIKSPTQEGRTSVLLPLANNFLEMTPQRVVKKNGIFSNDQELFLDSGTPLIMVHENNVLSPMCRPSGRVPAPSDHRTVDDERLETESKRSDVTSRPRLSVWSNGGEDSSVSGQVSASITARKARLSQSQMSNSQGFLKNKGELSEKAGLDNSQAAVDKVDIFKTEEEEKEENPFKLKLKAILDSIYFNAFVGLFIFWALFAADFRVLALDPVVDLGFDIVSLIALGVFSIEIVLTLIVRKEYLWSFFFWLDIISTVSIILDVEFISDDFFPEDTKNTAQIARASRASRIGTKAGRVVRIFRLVRLAKVYKQVDKTQKEKEILLRAQSLEKMNSDRAEYENDEIDQTKVVPLGFRSLTRKPTFKMQKTLRQSKSLKRSQTIVKPVVTISEEVEEDSLKESRVGKKLSDLTTRRLIILVMGLLLIIPFFSSDFYFDDPVSLDYDTDMLNILLSDSRLSSTVKQAAIKAFMEQQSTATPQLIYLQIGNTIYYPNADTASLDLDDPNDLRDTEQDTATATGSSEGDITATTSTDYRARLEAGLNIARTFFVCIVLVLGALFFAKDANNLVLRPIERMIEKVNKIAKDPMVAKDQALVRDKHKGLENETIQIENAIIKIGGLLALGFGDAGSSIVTQNMARSGDLNPMLPGRKEMAIFGFCDIRNFTDATEVLQQEVMVFVNSIADVVHSVVDLHSGSANKNIGDAFLLVWKIPEGEITESDDMSLEIRDSRFTQSMADLALISFLKINVKINRDPTLLAYRLNTALNARLPNYQVKMGFGLHVGWAIEGAIGSEFKVDASYLSPNVNLASRLEAATKQYGVPLLFSGELYSKLSKGLKQKCRLIDIVTVKGSLVPMEMYTVDMDLTELMPAGNRNDLTRSEKRELQKFLKKKLWQDIMERTSVYVLESDKELVHIFRHHDPEFNEIFEDGFNGYIQGDWALAKKRFERCLELREEDGPTKNLLGFLKDHDYIAPEDWKGFHVLTEK